MRRLLLALVLLLAYVAPFKLMVLGVEALAMRPGNVRLAKGDSRYWEAQDLEARLRRYGWSVTYVDGLIDNENAFGMTTYEDRTIQIDASLSWDERYVTLVHEAGHTQQPYRLTREQGEIFAEAVSTLMSHTGFREHARYLAGLKPDVIPVLLVHWGDIYRAADNLRN